ncbi:WD40-repeat-containing domain protein [Armillaria novae-zelandiae]|uniref:WD40-repeat-containing domain protein n=1 Tax=Armillaria novae-zelandiae TaxID=153914 RepID=A0AA39NNK4_9AGAR|nr:WD40-repeat-containing domain protein [Armillaria novae-zelandiae]
MSRVEYRLQKTIQGEDFDSVNVLTFSKDGALLAAAFETGAVKVYRTHTGKPVSEYSKEPTAIDVLLWSLDDSKQPILYVGTRSGKVFRYDCPDKKEKPNQRKEWMASLTGPIRCMDLDSTKGYLIIGHGSHVSALRRNTHNNWRIAFEMVEPPSLIPTNFTRPAPYATGIHVPRQNNTCIVSYLEHGVVCFGLDQGDVVWSMLPERRIGSSAVSTDGMLLAGTNLYDGIDFYAFSLPRKRGDVIADKILTNVIVPVRFIHDDEDILVGGSAGVASIMNIAAKQMVFILEHSISNDTVQAIAYTRYKGVKYIATGNTEKGPDCSIKLWICYPPDWNPGVLYRIFDWFRTRDATASSRSIIEALKATIYWTVVAILTVFIASTLMVVSQTLASSQYNPVIFFKWLFNGAVDYLKIGGGWLTDFRVVRVNHEDLPQI